MKGLMMNTPLTITSIMRHADSYHPDAEIVSVTKDVPLHRYTYADSFRRIRQLANALKKFGIKPGDCIGTLAWNDYRHFEIYFAVSCSGAVTHTVNPRLFPDQIRYIINHAEDRLLFVDPQFVPIIEELRNDLPTIEAVIVLTNDDHMTDSALSDIQSYESFIQGQPKEFDWPDIDENTACGLCYTSGTTGNPKGVLYSHRSNVLHSWAVAMPDAFGLSSRDAVMPLVPMYHANAWGVPYVVLITGSKLILLGSKMGDGATIHSMMTQERVTFSLGVPTIWMMLLNYLEQNGGRLDSLQRIIVGGASCPPWMINKLENEYGVNVRHSWGMTEMSPVGSINTPKNSVVNLPEEQQERIKLKAGRPVYGVELKIVDEEDNELPHDGITPGLLKVKGPWICSAYYKLEESDNAQIRDGWLSTGDVVTIDAEGYIQITDRSKDVIKSGGEWISSIALENTTAGHPAVAEAAVIGIFHEKWQERPLLIVVKKAGMDVSRDEIITWLTDKVAKWWLPDDVVFVEEIPHTATGKIHKTVLRERFKDYSLK